MFKTMFLENDSQLKADSLLEKLKETCLHLENFPSRGYVPPELKRINIGEYLEVYFKPYRNLYQIVGKQVVIHCVLDGRRSPHDLLLERLVR